MSTDPRTIAQARTERIEVAARTMFSEEWPRLDWETTEPVLRLAWIELARLAVDAVDESIRAAERRRYLAEMLASEDAWIGEEEDQWEREKHVIARDIIQGYLTQIEEGDAP